jgi:hypothetical protein
MSVTYKHLQGLVSRDSADFHYVQIGVLEEPAYGFMPQVMKMQVFDTCNLARFLHGLSDEYLVFAEYLPLRVTRLFLETLEDF